METRLLCNTIYFTYRCYSLYFFMVIRIRIRIFLLAAFWHWAYWDLDVFVLSTQLVLDLHKILGIHLLLTSLACFGFGLAHVTGFYGPGMWTSDSFGIVGSIRLVKPIYSVIGLAPFCYGVISSNHIGAGFFGITIGTWHISTRPAPLFYKLFFMGNVESVLTNSIPPVFSLHSINNLF